jgi:hypothetical protein
MGIVLVEFGTGVRCKGKYLVRSYLMKSVSYICTLDIKHSLECRKLWCVSQKKEPAKRDRYKGILER